MGRPQTVEEYALVPEAIWGAAMLATRLPVSGAADGPALEPRPLLPVEHARGRAVFSRLRQAHEQASGALGAPAAAATTTVVARKTKLSTLVDTAAEGDLVPINLERLHKMFSAYKAARGALPKP